MLQHHSFCSFLSVAECETQAHMQKIRAYMCNIFSKVLFITVIVVKSQPLCSCGGE